MATRTFILMYGRDPLLQKTRQLLLQSAGYQVEIAERFSDIRKISALHRVDLLILCHSITQEDALIAAELIERRWPDSKCLALSAERDAPDIDPCGEWLQALEGPRKFINKVQKLVGVSGETAALTVS
jgi:DNA-binding NtrC family response regulator